MVGSYWSRALAQRLSRRRIIAAAGGAALSTGIIAACGGDDTESQRDESGLLSKVTDDSKSAKRGGTLVKWGAESLAFNPMTTGGGTTILRYYSRLFRIQGGHMGPPTGEVEGDLAEGWEFGPDKLQLTVKLTPKAHFAPSPQIAGVSGRVPDARDVVFSWEYLKAIGTQRASLAYDINPQAPVVSLSAPDDRTVVIKLAQPVGSALTMFGPLAIVPKEAGDPKILNLQTQGLGSGPWYLAELVPSAYSRFKRNPGFGQDPRGVPYIDEVFQPVVPEYAAQLAQLKAGNIHIFPELADIRPEDVLATKGAVPELEMLSTDIRTNYRRMLFGQLPESPFRDERVRQAWSMAQDRDLLIDVLSNVGNFKAAGLPMETAWSSTALQTESWKGWWLDAQGKDFGPNAKYFKFDPTEAKKLLAAAGFPSGLDVSARYPPGGHPFGTDYTRTAELVLGMVKEAGFRPKTIALTFATEYRALTLGAGRFEGVSFAQSGSFSNAIDYLYNTFNSTGGGFHGWDPDGKSTYAGDPLLDDLTSKIRLEFDDKKRIQLAHELQRYDAAKQYTPWVAGGANSFILHWPSIRGRLVWQNDQYREDCTYWLDQTKPPFTK